MQTPYRVCGGGLFIQDMCSHSTSTNPSLCPPHQAPPSLLHLHIQHPHLCRASTSTQVVAELPSEAPAKARGKLGVQCQAFVQPSQLQTLQDAVCQPFHVSIGLDHLFTPGQFTADQVTLPWGEKAEVSEPAPQPPRRGVTWRLLSFPHGLKGSPAGSQLWSLRARQRGLGPGRAL